MTSDSQARVLRRLALGLDVAVLPASWVLALGLHQWARAWVPALHDAVAPENWALTLYLAVPLWVALVLALDLPRSFEARWSGWTLALKLAQLHGLWFLGLAGAFFATQGVLNRALVGFFLVGNLLLTWLVHASIGLLAERRWARGDGREGWLLVGTPGPTMRRFAIDLAQRPFPPLVRTLGEGEAPADFPAQVVGAPADLPARLHEGGVDRVVFFPPLHHPELAGPLLHACEQRGTPASFVIDFGERFPLPPTVEVVGDRACLTWSWVPPRGGALVLKGLVDVVGAFLILLVLWPLLAVVALAVLLAMGRPVLFAQERAGLNGRRFRMLKFRTMVPGAEAQRDALLARNEMSGPVFKVTDDPRVTPLGRFLRKWSLDELPQFFNVLGGTMSLVGPRPLPVKEQLDIEGWHRRRLSMKPGITGLWQVSGRNDVDFEAWMRLDLRYVEQWSLGLDLKLLLLTLPAVLWRRGAR